MRRLGFGDAVVLGLGSMLGAGVFASFGPAAAAAGSGLLIALAVVAVVAYCNATASARLAAVYPESGGTYVYGRRRLGPVWGFTAGWGFVVGKTASCAAMALTFGAYAWPANRVPPAVAAVLVLTAVNYRGVAKTAGLTRVLVAATLLALVVVVIAGLGGGAADPANLTGWTGGGVTGIGQAAALLFFSFAGYARIATLGAEVRDPATTIPRAIPVALGVVLVVYAVIAVTALLSVGPDGLAAAAAPLAAVAGSGTLAFLAPVVQVGGAVASAGVLLSLIAGIGRTTLAMARDHELPAVLGAVHPRFRVPHRAELVLGAVVVVIVLVTDVRGAIGFSSFAVLVYYAITNAAAFTLGPDQSPHRGRLRAVTVVGLLGCLGLAFTLPPVTVAIGVVVLAVGVAGRAVLRTTRS
ncbi:amino acid/polyamine/organocation transporter (APC superfamily) [Pseudonocardia kunmingensis]|uniref:Amino acid/polyamine/organocation transporter (APC superfamily) n=1 Tax=Pseudonocardia kunmingensis TaxID=630975 RepID=A0A543D9T6_9PSEU|nr:amino acid/polyamine/organocation transporter (APC superfamily) [Pseudonocardia kunmingensis]